MIYVTDTHSLVWYFIDDSQLSKQALNVFEKTIKKGIIIIPILVLAENMYISKKGRITISFQETLNKIDETENFDILPLDTNILKIADKLDVDLEMHDRLITATAVSFDAPLITKDRRITDSKVCKTIW